MKRLLAFFLLLYLGASAQTKKIVFEEFTGALCGNCPSGAWIVDSLTRKYPDLIGVAIHSYGVTDAMYFAGCDSIDDLVNTQGGAPFGDLDRMKYPVSDSPLYMFFSYLHKFDSLVQVRLSAVPLLTVDIVPTWTSITRTISAQVNIHILANLPASDYRVSLYVVEDSVTGTGSGYDQENFYDTSPPGNPFFGMGNPILGYVHRHVSRAALPSPLGAAGILPAAPLAGQDFSTTMNYILPASINENRTSLVAFVYKYAPSGVNNEILNAEEISLLSQSTGIISAANKENSILIFPNPVYDEIKINFQSKHNFTLEIFNCIGESVIALSNSNQVDVSNLVSGMYFLEVSDDGSSYCQKFIKQ